MFFLKVSREILRFYEVSHCFLRTNVIITSLTHQLIAEDELLIAKVLRMQLESIGFEVENFTDGREVFDKVKQMNPHIIILDVHLKNNSCGFEVGREIRAAGIDTPIIFTTGNSFDNTHQMVKDIGKSSVLIKPVEFEQILQMINQIKIIHNE